MLINWFIIEVQSFHISPSYYSRPLFVIKWRGLTGLSLRFVLSWIFDVLWSSDQMWNRYLYLLSCIWLFETPWTVARQAPPSMKFSRQEYWSGLPFLTPGDLLDPKIKPMSLECPALAGGFFTTEPPGKHFLSKYCRVYHPWHCWHLKLAHLCSGVYSL